jgi:hypothetical protein
MPLRCDLASGPSVKSVQASVEAGNDGYPGRVSDELTVAK